MEIIVKYVDGIRYAEELFPGIRVVELFNQYAIVTIEEEQLEEFSALPEVVYVELPKRVYYNLQAGRRASCLSGVQGNPNISGIQGGRGRNLTGSGVFVAIVDSGVDLRHPAFIGEDGESRIAFFWDQTKELDAANVGEGREDGGDADLMDEEGAEEASNVFGRVPERYQRGREYTREEIDRVIGGQENLENTERGSGHGTGVAGIAAGNGRGSQGLRYRGIATESQLLVVKLGRGNEDFAGTTDVMMGVDYVLRKALELGRPIAINLSFGTNQGAHDGNTLFEQYLSDLNGVWKNVIVVATGNEGDTRHHARVHLQREEERMEFAVGSGERNLLLQIWKQYVDEFRVALRTPSGERFFFPSVPGQSITYPYGGNRLYFFLGAPTPFQDTQELSVEWMTRSSGFVESGIWTVEFYPDQIGDGRVDLWLPTVEAIGLSTGFLQPEVNTTLTIPATARKVITVGAYRSDNDTVANFSGRGNTVDGRQVPIIVAPGVGVVTARPGGSYGAQTGTSFAAPFVTGSAALMMEWGIVQGNDPYLYGEKMQAYLARGARRLVGQLQVPDVQAGYGALCVSASLPE
ncbi:MAG: S8 family peptidase [Lachnospiraceae bacterium]|nr:S8 family peptidase [Lachnospiraceae bacterium]